MAGYIHDPLQIINLIADNLRDRYESGFPVLKEIIQNVDDAGDAEEKLHLEFGVCDGLPQADHPLLKGPALYFLNNGNFTDSDSRAIRSFGLNQKAAEQSAIGKFGLGMKSVFHFCEAFFFLAKNSEKTYEQILNPWSGDDEFSSFHSDWDIFSPSDKNLIRKQLKTAISQAIQSRNSYFLLWLPLRKKEHLLVDGNEVGSIISEFPGDDNNLLSFLYQEDLAQRLASLLPLLRRVTSLRFCESNLEPRFEVTLDKRSKRIDLVHEVDCQKEMVGAAIYYKHKPEKKNHSLYYAGYQSWPDTPELKILRDSPLWPKTFIRNEHGISEEAPDRARGHGAAVFSYSNEKGRGRLDVNWAVFLPIGEKNTSSIRCEGDYVFRLTLHGHFFIDAGRAYLEGLLDGDEIKASTVTPENEAELRRQWNRILASRTTLPHILPALKSFVSRAKLSSDNTWNLCQALAGSQFFGRYRKSICATNTWVCCLTSEGREWQMLPSNMKLLPFPAPPVSDPKRPWSVFHKLEQIEHIGTAVVVLKSAPHLHIRPLPQWEETDLLEVLQIDEKSSFSDQGRLEYLLTFLRDDTVHPLLGYGSLQDRLKEIAKRAFVSMGYELQQNRSKVQEYVGFIQPKNRYQIRLDSLEILRELQSCSIEPLVVMRNFDSPAMPGKAQLSMEDALMLLEKLHGLILGYEADKAQSSCDQCRAISTEILKGQDGENHRTLLGRARNLRVLEGYDCSVGKKVSLSPAEIEACRTAQLLFNYSQGVNASEQHGLAPKLQAVLKQKVILINRATADLLFGKGNELTSSNANSVLDSLGEEKHAFLVNGKRQHLLAEVAGADLSTATRIRGIRYLLHAQVEYFDNEDTLWVSGFNQNPVWQKLWQQVNTHHQGGWNLLERVLLAEIPPNKWRQIGIREIQPQEILDELRNVGTDQLVGDLFTPEERTGVLKELAGEENLWKQLPFHETIRGDLVKIIPQQAYLESDIYLVEELHKYADIVICADDPTVKNQQRTWIPSLTQGNVITIALKHKTPEKYRELVMTNLDGDSLRHCRAILRNIPWLIDRTGNTFRPEDIVHLEKIQDEVDRLLAHTRGVYCSPANLHGDIQAHPSFQLLADKCFSTKEEGFDKLVLLLMETEQYRVGRIQLDDEGLNSIVEVCSKLPVGFNLPGWTLLAKALEFYPKLVKELRTEVLQPISSEKTREILRWLQEEHGQANGAKKKRIQAAYNSHLTALVDTGVTTDELSKIFLLNREGSWKPAAELCADVKEVADSHMLDDGQVKILREVIIFTEPSEVEPKGREFISKNILSQISVTATQLKDFFADWEGLVSPELICAFISILGDDKDVIKLAENYRGRRSIEWIRDRLHSGPEELQFKIKMRRFIVHCIDGDEVKTSSILGDSIVVPLKSVLTSLIAGEPEYEIPYTQNGTKNYLIPVCINLRRPQLDNFSPSNLVGLLRVSTEYLLKREYKQQNIDLGSLWEKLDTSEQLDIRIAQQLVLSHIPFYLPQLGVHKHVRLKDLLDKWNDTRYKVVEYQEDENKKKIYEEEQKKHLFEIQILLKDDAGVQEAVLNAVRAKMRDYQYTPASIPFELFQNSDDAVVELAAIYAHPDPSNNVIEQLPDHTKRFLVLQDENKLTFIHWGRPVNSVGTAGFPGRDKGYHRDLEKMLVLSSSDKSAGDEVTGKFGLGFKSVLLACDRPKLLSGRLAIEIVGGLCPVPVENSSELRSRLQELSPERRWPGTLVELSLREDTRTEVMESFNRNAGIMTIFSKGIRRIEMQGQVVKRYEWAPDITPLSKGAVLEFGLLPFDKGLQSQPNALYLRLPAGGILFALGPKGFRPLPDIPAIWVVAPAKEKGDPGFAVNCNFDLDAGRARLAGDSESNQKKAFDLGQAFGNALLDISAIVKEGWELFKKKLCFESDLSLYDFWLSLWDTIQPGIKFQGNEQVKSIINKLLCDGNGLGIAASHNPIIPNGLWGAYRTLLKVDSFDIVLKGCLEEELYFVGLSNWAFFREILEEADGVISRSMFSLTKKVIPELCEERDNLQVIGIIDVLNRFKAKKESVAPGDANVLGLLFSSEGLKSEELDKERDVLIGTLQSLKFRSQDGFARPTKVLLAGTKHDWANPDEMGRASFAPDRHVLSHEYTGAALNFFFACREQISIKVEEMADWLFNAETQEKRKKGLHYLVDGEHGNKLAKLLRSRDLTFNWLSELEKDSTYFNDWEENDIDELLLRILPSIDTLRDNQNDQDYEDEQDSDEEEFGQYDPKEILPKIHQWWLENHGSLLPEYERRIYPDNLILNLDSDDVGRIDRSSWLAVFCIAHFQTMGRQRDGQHKGFIEKCIRKDWWDIFSQAKPEQRSDEWMGVLEQFVEEQEDSSEYELWMNHFPAIYKFSRWLDDYHQSFLSINRMTNFSDLSRVMLTRVNPDFQGGGVSAPPITKTLSLGACFVVRELKRKDVLNGNDVDAFCYLPNERLRNFCTGLGCTNMVKGAHYDNAKQIHKFLCEHLGDEGATFAGCYDIPLQLFLADRGMQSLILS